MVSQILEDSQKLSAVSWYIFSGIVGCESESHYDAEHRFVYKGFNVWSLKVFFLWLSYVNHTILRTLLSSQILGYII